MSEPLGTVEAYVTGGTAPLPEDEESAIIDEEMRATDIIMARLARGVVAAASPPAVSHSRTDRLRRQRDAYREWARTAETDDPPADLGRQAPE